MATPKLGLSKSGQPMHYSVGAVIRVNGRYLLLDRMNPPMGFAAPAGHIDEGEDPLTALAREVIEETGFEVISQELLFEEEIDWNYCKRGITTHYWYLYRCTVQGELHRNLEETKSMDWYTPQEIMKLKLEPVWEYWLKKIGVIE